MFESGWLLFAIGSAVFAGLTSILAKCGIRRTDSNVATFIRTIVVLIFAWAMVFITGSFEGLSHIDGQSLFFLVLSGIATGGSWLCYFRALQLGNVNKVVPVDKSSIVLTILLAFILLGETVGPGGIIGLVAITIGTFLMIERKDVAETENDGRSWLLYAVGSAVFASLQAILGKVGITGIESDLGTAVRTIVVLFMAGIMVLVTRKASEIRKTDRRELSFICLSGIATGASWLCFYRALQDGPASVVIPIDKLSILVTIAFAFVVFGERLSKKSAIGLLAIVVGTVLMVI